MLLIEEGYALDISDKNGRTLSWCVLRYSRLDIMKLLEPYARIVSADREIIPWFAVAARYGCTKTVKLLLNLNRDVWYVVDSDLTV
jgi:hypothetical protein